VVNVPMTLKSQIDQRSSGAGRAISDRRRGLGPFGLFAVTPDPFSSDEPLSRTASYPANSIGYERGSIILTSNKSYGEWGSIFGDPIIATAILDRLLHHSTTINIRGESYRLKERRKDGLIPLPEQQQDQAAVMAHRSRSKRDQLP
jgi:IstB-like ATP binding protein